LGAARINLLYWLEGLGWEVALFCSARISDGDPTWIPEALMCMIVWKLVVSLVGRKEGGKEGGGGKGKGGKALSTVWMNGGKR
jgi:hypothetical protein